MSKPRKTTAPASGGSSGLAERVAYYALLAVPVVVPTVIFKVPFVAGPPLTFNPAVIPKLFAFAVLMAVALVAWAFGVIRGDIATRSVPLKWWLVAFLGLSAASTATGLRPVISFFGNGMNAVGLLTFLLGAALFFLVGQIISSAERIRALSWSVAAGGAVVGVVGLLQQVGADPLRLGLEYYYAGLRVPSLLGNSDFAGAYLVVPLIVAAALALSERNTVRRTVASGCFVASLLCLLATGTRGAWLGAVAGLVALGFALVRGERRVGKSTFVAIGVAVGLPLVWAIANAKNILIRFADLSQGSAAGGGRIPIWGDALRVIAKYPLLGTGPDTYLLGWSRVRVPAWVGFSGSTALVDDPHNLLLLFAATLGIPATIAVIGLVVRAVAIAAGPALQRGESRDRRLYAGWWAALIGLAVTSLFTIDSVAILLVLFLTLGVVVTVHAKRAYYSKPLRLGLASAAVLLALGAGVAATLYVVADARIAQAQNAADPVAVLEQAARTAPWYGEARYRAVSLRAQDALSSLAAGAPTAQEDVRLADERLEQLVAFNPLDVRYRISQATFLVDAGRYLGPEMLRRAVSAGQVATGLNPGNPRSAYILALAQYEMGDPGAAALTAEPVWDADPKYVDAGLIYVQALVTTGDRASAGEVLTTLEQRFPGNESLAQLRSQLTSPSAGP